MIFDRWLSRASSSPPAAAVRPLAPADATTVAAIHAASFARGWEAGEFERLIAAGNSVGDGILAPDGRTLDGFALSRVAADEAEILTIAVAKARRGRGLGRRLLAHHLGSLAARGARRVFLEVEAENAAALALYRGFGFEEIGRRQGYYRKADGSTATAIVMARDLL
ncbi:ribosomal protein S18-alanine N-acetyltransferase [Chelatococcus composti]|jgi:ribosomal-protein-alanine N-acetyltransferase|uniref:Ribosomal-protein-alanine N-acetyltransferase n=1 Tax=Chelatococcus composti TaxID=1743235 RepID=A0A841K4T2_9HYPH|nr:ribosomal protein S18-alanine N-acetyltransferase [Chelatococcus composti]MBB6167501.1 ribosomal-protein-alanine N-acetyltransferase [Chelatococcus composti]MBS7735705.1 ribosomal protein S18-alanine N-acetyltransferase [Chelatococcus composti]GGG32373.1 ribosomal-protein-alanine acetyltransferase [Chelatococcus composti]